MSLLPFCEWLASTPGSIALHESLFMYPLVESVHVLTLCLFVGMTMMLDLRLTGRRAAPACRSPTSSPACCRGCSSVSSIMVVTGVLLFYAIPIRSYQNIFFRTKAIFLVLAGAECAAPFTPGLSVRRDVGHATRSRRSARASPGTASLVLWALVIVTGPDDRVQLVRLRQTAARMGAAGDRLPLRRTAQ